MSTPRPLQAGRHYTADEIAQHAFIIVNRIVGRGPRCLYQTRKALCLDLGIKESALSAALAMADPKREASRETYVKAGGRRQGVLQLILSKFAHYDLSPVYLATESRA